MQIIRYHGIVSYIVIFIVLYICTVFIAWDGVTRCGSGLKVPCFLATKAQTRQLATCKSVVPTDPRQHRFGCFSKMGYQPCYGHQIIGDMLINQWLEWILYFETNPFHQMDTEAKT